MLFFRTLPLHTTSIYANSYNVDLTGIPVSGDGVSTLEPALITSPPPPTSPRPTCAPAATPAGFSPTGSRFGDEDISYATYNLISERNKFNKRWA